MADNNLQQAYVELAKRELAKRQAAKSNASPPGVFAQMGQQFASGLGEAGAGFQEAANAGPGNYFDASSRKASPANLFEGGMRTVSGLATAASAPFAPIANMIAPAVAPVAGAAMGAINKIPGAQTPAGQYTLQNAGRALNIGGTMAGFGSGAIEKTAAMAAKPLTPAAEVAGRVAAPAVTAMKGAATATDSAIKGAMGLGSLKTVTDAASTAFRKATLPARISSLNNTIVTDFTRAMQRSVGSVAKTISAKSKSVMDVARGVRTIVENKGVLKLTDENNLPVENAVPHTLPQFGQAIQQVKQHLFGLYDTLAERANAVGAKFDATPTLDTMKKYITESAGKTDAQISHMGARLGEVERLNGASYSQVQNYIATLNNKLNGVFSTGAEREVTQGEMSIAQHLNEQMDKQISNLSGPGYRALRKSYGAVKSMENMVAKAIYRRAPEGLGNLVNVFSGEEMALGLVTMNPYAFTRGATLAGVRSWIKHLNNPDRAVTRMFNNVDQVYQDAAASGKDIKLTPDMPPERAPLPPTMQLPQGSMITPPPAGMGTPGPNYNLPL